MIKSLNLALHDLQMRLALLFNGTSRVVYVKGVGYQALVQPEALRKAHKEKNPYSEAFFRISSSCTSSSDGCLSTLKPGLPLSSVVEETNE
ncbi:hypothetical protein WN943_014480 [Citrus x changshan-huyou]